MTTRLDDLRLTMGGDPVGQQERNFGDQEVEGTLHYGVLSGPNGLAVNVSYRQDVSGLTGELRCVQVISGPPQLKSLENRLRIGVLSEGGMHYAEMMLAYLPGIQDRAKKRKVSLDQLDSAVGGSSGDFLKSKGVVDVAPRAALFGDTGRRRSFLAASVTSTAEAEPLLWVLAVTRVLPILRQIETGRF